MFLKFITALISTMFLGFWFSDEIRKGNPDSRAKVLLFLFKFMILTGIAAASILWLGFGATDITDSYFLFASGLAAIVFGAIFAFMALFLLVVVISAILELIYYALIIRQSIGLWPPLNKEKRNALRAIVGRALSDHALAYSVFQKELDRLKAEDQPTERSEVRNYLLRFETLNKTMEGRKRSFHRLLKAAQFFELARPNTGFKDFLEGGMSHVPAPIPKVI